MKHLATWSTLTNISERAGQSKELTESHHCDKLVCEISSHLDFPQSTLSGIITKRKHLGTTATQIWSSRLCEVTEQGHWAPNSRQRSVDSLSSKPPLKKAISPHRPTLAEDICNSKQYNKSVTLLFINFKITFPEARKAILKCDAIPISSQFCNCRCVDTSRKTMCMWSEKETRIFLSVSGVQLLQHLILYHILFVTQYKDAGRES